MSSRFDSGDAKFQAGQRIRVASSDRIAARLDALGRRDGCLLMRQMWDYCGQEFLIAKPVHHLFDESKLKMYRPKPSVYILEGVICDGRVDPSESVCDHCCYLFWHEDWLETSEEGVTH